MKGFDEFHRIFLLKYYAKFTRFHGSAVRLHIEVLPNLTSFTNEDNPILRIIRFLKMTQNQSYLGFLTKNILIRDSFRYYCFLTLIYQKVLKKNHFKECR